MSGFGLITLGSPLHEQLSLACECERVGFRTMWASEFYDRSSTITLAAMAERTSTLRIGAGIAYAFGRAPIVLASEARDLDSLSEGRLVLGLGTGTKRMQQDWLGAEGTHPAARCEELVPLLRQLWRIHEGPVSHEGRFFRTVVTPTAKVSPPFRPEIPIYLAAVNRRMLEAVGAVADGLLGHPLFTPEYLAEVVRPALAAGAARTGRNPEVPISGLVLCSVDEDRARARHAAAAQLAFYLTVKTYDSIQDIHGFHAEVDIIRKAWQTGDTHGMVAAVTDEMLDTWTLTGTPDEVRKQFEARWLGLYDETVFYPAIFLEPIDPRVILQTFGVH